MRTATPDGMKVAELRALLGMSQTELAKRAGLCRGAVQRAERSAKCLLGTLQRIATALKCEVSAVIAKNTIATERIDENSEFSESIDGGGPDEKSSQVTEIRLAVTCSPLLLRESAFLDALRVVIANADLVRILSIQGAWHFTSTISARPRPVDVWLQMTVSQVEQVMLAWDEGKLDILKIKTIDWEEIPRDPNSPT